MDTIDALAIILDLAMNNALDADSMKALQEEFERQQEAIATVTAHIATKRTRIDKYEEFMVKGIMQEYGEN
jgi:hypothetical protein